MYGITLRFYSGAFTKLVQETWTYFHALKNIGCIYFGTKHSLNLEYPVLNYNIFVCQLFQGNPGQQGNPGSPGLNGAKVYNIYNFDLIYNFKKYLFLKG